jgi:hypothetical protein
LRRGWAALLLLALGPACAPVLTHGPRVEPGLFLGSTLGLLIGQDTATAPDAVTPAWAPYVRYGFAGKPGGVAGSLALSVGNGFDVDAYLQLPSRQEWAYGGGVMASPAYVMPYVQAGQSFGRGYEVYTTQAYVHRTDFTDGNVALLDVGPNEVRPRYWAPSLALRRRQGALGASLEFTGAIGSYDQRPRGFGEGTSGQTTSRPLRALSASVTADVNLGQLLKDLAAITRRPIPRRPPGEP